MPHYVKEYDHQGHKDGPPIWDEHPITVESLSWDGVTDLLLARLKEVYPGEWERLQKCS